MNRILFLILINRTHVATIRIFVISYNIVIKQILLYWSEKMRILKYEPPLGISRVHTTASARKWKIKFHFNDFVLFLDILSLSGEEVRICLKYLIFIGFNVLQGLLYSLILIAMAIHVLILLVIAKLQVSGIKKNTAMLVFNLFPKWKQNVLNRNWSVQCCVENYKQDIYFSSAFCPLHYLLQLH